MKVTDAVERLGALAQETRLALFRTLVQQGPGGIAAGELAERLGIAPPNLSFHVATLERSGLVERRRNGRSVVYAASYSGMQELLAYLYENCCQGSGCAPRPRPAATTSAARKPRTKGGAK